MRTFLVVVAVVLVGVVVAGVLAWWWVKRNLSRFGAVLAELAGAAPPPFRITLEVADHEPDWTHAEVMASATAELEDLGYANIGDYRIPEMAALPLRAFAHAGLNLFAAVYEHPEVGLVTDLVCPLDDGWNITVSNAPDTGLDRPSRSPLLRMARSTSMTALHERMGREAPNRPRIEVNAQRFSETFLGGYQREMDWRIGRLGPTEEEIRRVAELSEEEPPDRAAIQLIQAVWKTAIDSFVSEQALDGYRTGTSMSEIEWEEQRENIVVVHDYCDPEDRIDELSWSLVGHFPESDVAAQGRSQVKARERLGEAFEGRSIREGFHTAQALLPEGSRYEPIGSVAEPWPADLYLVPEDFDAGGA